MFVYSYSMLFGKETLRGGIFCLPNDLFLGNTEENCNIAAFAICKARGWKVERLKKYGIQRVDQTFIEDIKNGKYPVSGHRDNGAVSEPQSDG